MAGLLKLTDARVLLEVTHVFKPDSVLLFTQVGKRSCKFGGEQHKICHQRCCDLQTFRDASEVEEGTPFVAVEEYKRLRYFVGQQEGNENDPSVGQSNDDDEHVTANHGATSQDEFEYLHDEGEPFRPERNEVPDH